MRVTKKDLQLKIVAQTVRIAELEAERNYTICAYCGKSFYTERRIELIRAHTYICKAHPMHLLSAKIEMLEQELANANKD